MNKSLLSKLLSRENINVTEGNFETASFNPTTRELKLPTLRTEFEDATNLFIGHEVGHALYTPDIFSHTERRECIKDIPFPILNILEDVRIERMVREEYPGLINDFKRGYRKLLSEDFFGIKDKDVNGLKFLDRINIKSKVGDDIAIDFSLSESVLNAKVYQTKSFDDVIVLARELMEFIKEQQQDQESDQSDTGESDSDTQETGISAESTDDDQGESEDEESNEESDKPSDSKDDESKDDESKDDESKEEPDTDPDEMTQDFEPDYSSDTDDAFRNNEDRLNCFSKTTSHITITREQVKESIITEDMINVQTKLYRESNRWNENTYLTLRSVETEFDVVYSEFIRKLKPQLSAMVNRFNMKQSANDSKKIQESTTGSIDVTKLWQYKLDDNIFKTSLIQPDAKNHGMMMFIDYSSSMSKRILETVKQSILLSMFAERINIPYQLYSFTTDRVKHGQERDVWNSEDRITDKYDIVNWAVGMIELSSSKNHKTKNARMMKRAMFNAWLIESRHQHFVDSYFHLGGTPLIETATFATIMVKDFIANNKIQKMNTIFLTDGSAQEVRNSGKSDYIGYSTNTVTLNIDGERIVSDVSKNYSTDQVLKDVFLNLRKYTKLQGFFLTARHKLIDRKKGFVTINDYRGYDSFMYILDEKMNSASDEFVTEDEESDNQVDIIDKKRLNSIKRDFKKFSKNRKVSKLIAEEIATIVA
jgi:hypothetical protein